MRRQLKHRTSANTVAELEKQTLSACSAICVRSGCLRTFPSGAWCCHTRRCYTGSWHSAPFATRNCTRLGQDARGLRRFIKAVGTSGQREFVDIFDAISIPETYTHDLAIFAKLGGGHLLCAYSPPSSAGVLVNVKAGMIFAVKDVATPVWKDYGTPALQSAVFSYFVLKSSCFEHHITRICIQSGFLVLSHSACTQPMKVSGMVSRKWALRLEIFSHGVALET